MTDFTGLSHSGRQNSLPSALVPKAATANTSAGRLKTTERYPVAVLEAGSSRSEGQQGGLLLEVLRESLFHAPHPHFVRLLAILGEARLTGTPRQALPPLSHAPSKDTSRWTLGPLQSSTTSSWRISL